MAESTYIAVNEIALLHADNDGSDTETACVYLPAAATVPPQDREMYLELNDGLSPSFLRVWLPKSSVQNLSNRVRYGLDPVGVRTRGFSDFIDGEPQAHETRFNRVFYLIRLVPAINALDEPIYEALFATFQWFWQYRCGNMQINMLSSDKTQYVAGALGSSQGLSYQEALNNLATQLTAGSPTPVNSFGLIPFAVQAKPHDMSGFGVPLVSLAHRLTRQIGVQIVADYKDTTASVVYSMKRLDYNVTTETESLTEQSARNFYGGADAEDEADFGMSSADGSLSTPLRSTSPKKIAVYFPKLPIVDASSAAGLETRYTIKYADNPLSNGGSIVGDYDVIYADHYDVAGKTYTEDLDAIALERGEIYFRRTLIPHRITVLIGFFDYKPGNTIRTVRWSFDSTDGCLTTVTQHGFHDLREWKEDKYTRLKSSSFPEENVLAGSSVFSRDDGTISHVGGGSSGSNILYCSVTSEYDDYLVCRIVDTTIDIFVAKPQNLRRNWYDGRIIDGATLVRTSVTTRNATVTGQTPVAQRIDPKYIETPPGPLDPPATWYIYAAKVPKTGVSVSGAELVYIDLNTDARRWASSC